MVGLRAVAITLCPARRAVSAIAAPRPEDEPVTSQVCGVIVMKGLVSLLDVVDCVSF